MEEISRYWVRNQRGMPNLSRTVLPARQKRYQDGQTPGGQSAGNAGTDIRADSAEDQERSQVRGLLEEKIP